VLIVTEETPENFYPLSLTRATFELRYGALCPLDRALLVSENVGLRCRPELAEYVRAKTHLPVNEEIPESEEHEYFPGLPARTPWEILAQSDTLIAADWDLWNRYHRNHRPKRMGGVHVIGGAQNVFLGERAIVQPGCVLDATAGPIIIAVGAQIKYSQIQGPAFIGAGCIVDGARVRPGTSLGPNCKVGGEIAATIFQARVNKAHEGFVGHSWAGRWVNFGALATTSNLKNTYGKIRYWRDSLTEIETGVQFLGALIGDHTKIGIGQMLATGSNLGVGCSVFGGGVAPKYIPSFSWGGAEGWQEYELEKCLKTVHATLARRNARLRPQSETVLRDVFRETRDERISFLNRRDAEAQRTA
jgi:UDP-N-acetylglucosamine diphosphorylase/glucosamine-1-phosphate N-acetyltransferase